MPIRELPANMEERRQRVNELIEKQKDLGVQIAILNTPWNGGDRVLVPAIVMDGGHDERTGEMSVYLLGTIPVKVDGFQLLPADPLYDAAGIPGTPRTEEEPEGDPAAVFTPAPLSDLDAVLIGRGIEMFNLLRMAIQSGKVPYTQAEYDNAREIIQAINNALPF